MSATRKSPLKERLWTVFFMFAVTLVSISIMAALHQLTKETVRQNEALFMMRAVLAAGGQAVPAGRAEVLTRFAATVDTNRVAAGQGYWIIKDAENGQPRGFAFLRAGIGLWGRITAVVGLDAKLAACTGVAFVEQQETPGLGARIVEPWFQEQFKGKTGPFAFVKEGTRSTAATEFDGITGATITTKGVRDMLNQTLKDAPGLIAAGGK